MFARTARNRRGWVLSLLGLLGSAGVLVPVLIIVGIALAVLIFGLPAFIGLLISPLRMIGILLLILAGAWLFISKDFRTSGIIGAVGLIILLGGQFGFLAVIGGDPRGTLTLLEGNKFYAYPKDGSPGTAFQSKYNIMVKDANHLKTWGNTCPPVPVSGEWVLVGKGYYNNVEVPIACDPDGVKFNRPSYDALRAAGLPLPTSWPGDYKISMKATMTYELRGTTPTPTGLPPSSLWARFLAWFRGVFA